jgi:hypothetical protein
MRFGVPASVTDFWDVTPFNPVDFAGLSEERAVIIFRIEEGGTT